MKKYKWRIYTPTDFCGVFATDTPFKNLTHPIIDFLLFYYILIRNLNYDIFPSLKRGI